MTLSNDTFASNAAAGGAGGVRTGTGTGAGGSGDPGGFGIGGAGGVAGGFGGGGGFGAAGGFGAGSNAGGGLAAGGNIFVQQGGQLTFSSGTATGGTLTASGGGQTYGSNIFIQGNTTITLGNVTLSGVIADQTGSGGLGPNAGAGGILAQGAVTLSGANTYTGGTTIEDSLTLKSAQAAGTGEISFTSGGSLIVGAGDTPANLIGGFVTGDTIDLKGIGLEKTTPLSGSNALTLSGAHAGPVTLNFDPLQNYASDTFILQSDGAGGTLLTVTQTQFTVGSESDLNTALAEIDAGGKYAVPNMAYTITFTASFTLGSDINAINLSSGDTLTINGAGNTVDGGGQYRGLFVYGGQVTLEDLTIQNAVAAGGAGGAGTSGGGGGAGLGGGLFVAAGTSVALDNVSFLNDQAIGGNGGAITGTGTGGGGGLGGTGGAGNGHSGGGGGVGTGAVGGTYGAGNGGNGILLGTGTGSSGTGSGAGAGGGNGGGGGIAGVFSGSGRDPRSYPGTAGAGGIAGSGNFGGGAGSGQPAGFGGGGAASNGSPYGVASGAGGWGGGGAGGAAGGFGAGAGSTGGGGGLGAGGAVFVQQGGTLTITDGTISGNSAAGGTGSGGGGNGSGYGSGIYFQGNSQLTLAPGTGQTLTVSDVITDTAGVASTAGQVSLLLNGAGTVTLSAANTYTGGTTLAAGTLSLQAPGAAGSGAITFSYGSTATLIIGSGDVPTNVIGFFLPGETIDLQGIGTATSAVLGAGDVLQVTGGTTNVNLSLYTGQIFTGETFSVATDTHGGTLLTAVTTGNDHPPSIAGVALNGDDHTAFAPLKGVTVSDLDSGQTETATLTLSTTADGKLSNLGGGNYNATTGVYTVTGTAAAVTTALDKLIFTPTNHQVAPGGVVTTGFDLSITDGTMTADTPFSVAVTALNDAPVISGGATQFDGYWNVALKPFAGVKIADPDKSASETVTLTVFGSGTATGTFSLAAPVDGVSLTETSPGVYTLTSASPSAVTAALHAVKFTPGTTNPAIGYTIASLGISVSDGIAPAVAGQGVTVYAGLPIVTGAAAGQSVVDTSTIAPFSHVHITDSAYFTSESVTIILTDSTGASTDANGTLSGTGLTKVGVGTYTLASGTPGAVTTAIEHLIFTPTPNQVPAGQSVTTGFQIAIFDGATTSDNYTTSVIATAPAAAVLNTATIGQPDMAFLTPAEHQAGVQPDNSLAGDKFSLLDLSPHDNQALFGAAPATDKAPAWGTGALLPDHNWPHAGALLGSKSLFSSHYG